MQARELVLAELSQGSFPEPILVVGLHSDLSKFTRISAEAQLGLRVLNWPGCQYLYGGDALREGFAGRIAAAVKGAAIPVPDSVRLQQGDAVELARTILHCLQNQQRALSGWRSTVQGLESGDVLNPSFATDRPAEEQRYMECADRFKSYLEQLQQGDLAESFSLARAKARTEWSLLCGVCVRGTTSEVDSVAFFQAYNYVNGAVQAQLDHLQTWISVR